MSRASTLVQQELSAAKRDLQARLSDIDEVRKRESELICTCARLREKIAELEHDQKAIDRGYIAIMCDNAATASTE